MNLWQPAAVLDLLEHIQEWGSMKKLVSSIKSNHKVVVAARSLLWKYFFAAAAPVQYSSPSVVPALKFLIYEGILTQVSEHSYGFSSPFVRALMLNHVRAKDIKMPTKAPPIDGGMLNLEELVVGSLPYFDKNTVTRLLSSKNAKAAGIKRFHKNDKTGEKTPAKVPNEALYNSQHFAIMKMWLPEEVLIDVETPRTVSFRNGKGQLTKCDTVVTLQGLRFIIEYVASGTLAEIREHVDRAAEYKERLNAVAVIIVNFTLVPYNDPQVSVYPQIYEGDDSIHIIHLFHNPAFTSADVIYDGISYNTNF